MSAKIVWNLDFVLLGHRAELIAIEYEGFIDYILYILAPVKTRLIRVQWTPIRKFAASEYRNWTQE